MEGCGHESCAGDSAERYRQGTHPYRAHRSGQDKVGVQRQESIQAVSVCVYATQCKVKDRSAKAMLDTCVCVCVCVCHTGP